MGRGGEPARCVGGLLSHFPSSSNFIFVCGGTHKNSHSNGGPQIPKAAVCGTSVKVTVSLLRGGLGGEELHSPVSLDGILRGSGFESRERCEEKEEK